MKIDFTLNNKHITLDTEPTKRLVDAIRDDLSLTVVIDGEAVTSCLVLVGQVQGKNVLTIEGLSELEIGRILQKCFVENGAVQCGFCTPGMLMSAYALLNKNQNPSKEEIKEAMSGNLCRCTGYVPILNSIEKAKDELKTLSKK